MSKAGKVLLIVAGALVVLGITLSTIALSRIDWRWNQIPQLVQSSPWGDDIIYDDDGQIDWDASGITREEKTFAIADIKSLVVEAAIDDIQIHTTADTDQIRVVYYDHNKYRHKADLSGNTLKVSAHTPRDGWFSWGWGSWSDDELYTIEIWLPEGLTAELDVLLDGTSGDIEVEGVALKRLRVESVSGDIDIASSTISELRLGTTSGDMEVDNVIGSNFVATSVSGIIEMDMSTFDRANWETTSGDMVIDSSHLSNLKAYSVSGCLEARIYGISSDYRIYTDSVSGDIRADRGADSSDKEIDIETVSGDIDINFISTSSY